MNIYEEEQKEKFWVWKSCIKQMSLSFQPRICPPLNLDFITKDRVEKKNENWDVAELNLFGKAENDGI